MAMTAAPTVDGDVYSACCEVYGPPVLMPVRRLRAMQGTSRHPHDSAANGIRHCLQLQ
jgi:hypothetical protein